MEFVAVPLEEAEGQILGHNIAGETGRRRFRKGRALSAEDIKGLRALGREKIYVARLAADDVAEDEAAFRVAAHIETAGLRLSKASTGRVNVYAKDRGLIRVDRERLIVLNRLEGVTLATLPGHTAVRPGRMVATLKIIPYALPNSVVEDAEEQARGGAILHLSPLNNRRVGLILSGSPTARERIVQGFESSLSPRLDLLGARIVRQDFVPLEEPSDEEVLAAKIAEQVRNDLHLLILAGETAIMDRFDIAPRAIESAGGHIEGFGAPVDPGNLLLLAYHQDLPILGAPGCARSPKNNIVDLVLPRLLAGDRLTQQHIAVLGHGGLLEDVPERPLPRSWLV